MKVKIPYIQLIGFIIAIAALVVGYYFYREDPIITIVSVAIASVASPVLLVFLFKDKK